jgi:hypothetical protein
LLNCIGIRGSANLKKIRKKGGGSEIVIRGSANLTKIKKRKEIGEFGICG